MGFAEPSSFMRFVRTCSKSEDTSAYGSTSFFVGAGRWTWEVVDDVEADFDDELGGIPGSVVGTVAVAVLVP